MTTEDRQHHLERLGEHEQYGVALKSWLKEESDKRNNLRKVDDWEDAVGKKAVIDFIKRELGILSGKKENTLKKNEYI